MVDSDTEDLLREFLGREKKAEVAGYTREAIVRAVDNFSTALQRHQKECEERWLKNEERHLSTDHRLRVLEAKKATEAAADDPAEITSSHRIDAIADKVKQATLESMRVPGGDPDSYVRKVVAEETESLEKRAELRRLQKKETDEREAAELAAKESRERNRLTFVAVVGTVGGAGILWAVQLLASHVH